MRGNGYVSSRADSRSLSISTISEDLTITGNVKSQGELHLNGQVHGDVHVTGTVAAERVVVDGTVEGPIQGGEVILKSQAHVVGDIHHQSLAIESGAFFDGRSMQIRGNGQTPEKLEGKSLRQITNKKDTLSRRAERAEAAEAD